MSSSINLYSNNNTLPSTTEEIIVTQNMILDIDGTKFTKQEIKDRLIDLKIIKSQLKKVTANVNQSE